MEHWAPSGKGRSRGGGGNERTSTSFGRRTPGVSSSSGCHTALTTETPMRGGGDLDPTCRERLQIRPPPSRSHRRHTKGMGAATGHQNRPPHVGSEPPTPDPATAVLLPPPNAERTSPPRHPNTARPATTRGVDKGPRCCLPRRLLCAGGRLQQQHGVGQCMGWRRRLGFGRRLSCPTEPPYRASL
jgi:hypothetical protein